MTREERIREMMEAFGFTRVEAEFAVAIENGEIDGDVIPLEIRALQRQGGNDQDSVPEGESE